MDNCNNLLVECLDEALDANGFDGSDFSHQLESKYDVSRGEISEKFEKVHDALKASFGIKHYAIERSLIQALHERQKTGQCSMDEEIQASAKVIDLFLEESERNLAASGAGIALLDFAKKLAEEVKDNKEQLRTAEWLAAIGQTAGMVGHDLRNPLQTIIGQVWLLRDELKKIPDNQTKNNLQESISAIEEQASYMDKIVSDLQTFVKPIQVNKTTIKLKNLVRAVLAKVAMPQKIRTHILVKSNQTVNADQELLKRVLINLFNNAVQAMPNGGELTIHAEDSDGTAIIIVKDTGVGIPESIKPNIFTPLFTTKSKGQGFGLSVCKRVVEAHGGTISFDSQVNKGTQFVIRLPK